MSYEIPGFKVGSLITTADLSSNQYYFVKVDSNGQIALCGDNEDAVGVLCNAPEASRIAEVMANGVVQVVAGAAIAKGAKIACDASGKAKTAISGYVLGTALEAASVDGDIITILLEKQGLNKDEINGIIVVDSTHGVAATIGSGFTVTADSQDGVFQIQLDSAYVGRQIIGANGQADVGVSYNAGNPDMSTVSSGILVSSKLAMSNLGKVWLGTYAADSTFAPTHFAGATISFCIKLL